MTIKIPIGTGIARMQFGIALGMRLARYYGVEVENDIDLPMVDNLIVDWNTIRVQFNNSRDAVEFKLKHSGDMFFL